MNEPERMELRYYELMMVVTPQGDEEGLSATLDTVNRHIGEGGGTVVRQQRWGNVRRLAYPIRSYREGSYVLTYLQLDPQKAGELEASLRVSEDILRHLLVQVDKIPEVVEEKPRTVTTVEESPVPPDSPVAEGGVLQEIPSDGPVPLVEEQATPVAEEPESSLLGKEPPDGEGPG